MHAAIDRQDVAEIAVIAGLAIHRDDVAVMQPDHAFSHQPRVDVALDQKIQRIGHDLAKTTQIVVARRLIHHAHPSVRRPNQTVGAGL